MNIKLPFTLDAFAVKEKDGVAWASWENVGLMPMLYMDEDSAPPCELIAVRVTIKKAAKKREARTVARKRRAG